MYPKPRRKFSSCPNCDSILRESDNFCPHCGQENHHLNVPFFHLVGEFIESIFHIDTKFWETMKSLFIPGKLTNEFVAGKRMRYMPPARLYIMLSFVFFLIVNYGIDDSIKDIDTKDISEMINDDLKINGKEVKLGKNDVKIGKIDDAFIQKIVERNELDNTPAIRDTISKFLKDRMTSVYVIEDENDSMIHFTYEQLVKLKSTKNADSILNTYLKGVQVSQLQKDLFLKIIRNESKLNSGFSLSIDTLNYVDDDVLKSFRSIKDNDKLDSIILSYKEEPDFKARAVFRKYYDYKNFDPHRDLHLIFNLFTKYLSYIMFLLMPIVAIALLAINYRWKRYYYEYLIFSIHTHTVLFFFASLEILLRMLLHADNTIPVYTIMGMFIYIPIALKNVYRQSWKKTLLKFAVISLFYSLLFIILISILLFYSAINF